MINREALNWAIDNSVTIADLEVIGFPDRLRDLLDNRGIIRLEQLLNYTFEELTAIPGIGEKYIRCIKLILMRLPQLKQKLEARDG